VHEPRGQPAPARFRQRGDQPDAPVAVDGEDLKACGRLAVEVGHIVADVSGRIPGQHAGERLAVDRIGPVVDARDFANQVVARAVVDRRRLAQLRQVERHRGGIGIELVPGIAQHGDRVGVGLRCPHRPGFDARLVVMARELRQRGDEPLL
jgi:hypothetical protein